MQVVRSMSEMVRQGVLALSCVLGAGLLAPQAKAQVGVAGSVTRGGNHGGAPAGSGWGIAARPDLDAQRWHCRPGFGTCLGGTELRLILERQRRFEVLRGEAPAAQAPVSGSLWRGPPRSYLPPPTPADQIVPAYQDRSLLRPEFRDSGTALD